MDSPDRSCTRYGKKLAGCLFGAAAFLLGADRLAALPLPPEFEVEAVGEADDVAREFDRVVLSASKSAQSIEEAPAIISVITAEDIRRNAYRSVGDALRSVPGVYVVDDHLKLNAGVRGISGGARGWSSILKVMINGQPVSFRPDTTNYLGPELIPIDAVKQIEVIRGPASALYGANAYLGVINILTKSGEDVAGGLVAGGGAFGSNYNEGGGAMMAGMRQGVFDVLVSGNLRRADRSGLTLPDSSPHLMRFAGDRASEDDRNTPASVFGQVALRLSPAANLIFDGTFQRLDANGEFQDWHGGSVNSLTHKSRLVENNTSLRLAFEGSSGSSSYRAFGAYVFGDPGSSDRFDVGLPDRFNRRRVDYKGVDGGAEYRLQLAEKSSITVGVDTSFEDQQLQVFDQVNPMTGAVVEAPDARMASMTVTKCIGDGRCGFNNVAGYIQAIYYPIAKIGMTGGFRVDRHNIYGVQPNGRVGLVFLPTDKIAVKALYGASFKAPSAVQLFTQPLGSGDVQGNEDLKPQNANTFEGAAVISPTRSLRAELTGFVTFISDQVQFRQAGANQRAQNIGDARSIGGEAEISYQPISPLRTFVQASYVTTEVTEQVTATEKRTVDLEELYPGLMLRGGAQFASDRHYLQAGLDAAYISSRGASQSNISENLGAAYSLDSYFLLGVSAGTRNLRLLGQRETALRVRAENILNQKYAEPGFRGIDIPAFGARVWVTLTQEI